MPAICSTSNLLEIVWECSQQFPVSCCGPATRHKAGEKTDLGLNPLWLSFWCSFLFKIEGHGRESVPLMINKTIIIAHTTVQGGQWSPPPQQKKKRRKRKKEKKKMYRLYDKRWTSVVVRDGFGGFLVQYVRSDAVMWEWRGVWGAGGVKHWNWCSIVKFSSSCLSCWHACLFSFVIYRLRIDNWWSYNTKTSTESWWLLVCMCSVLQRTHSESTTDRI